MLGLTVLVLLVSTLIQPVVPQLFHECKNYETYVYEDTDIIIMDLYLKFEQALMKDQRGLDHVRMYFLTTNKANLGLQVNLEVTTVNNTLCTRHKISNWNPTFCEDDRGWTSCDNHFWLTYRPTEPGNYVRELERKKAYYSTSLLAILHGNIFPLFTATGFFTHYYEYIYLVDYEYSFGIDLSLNLGNLSCNPDHLLTNCILANLISWIKVYSFSYPTRPTKWDKSDQGAVEIDSLYYDLDKLNFISSKLYDMQYYWLAMVEFFVFSISLALVIGKYFPATHEQIVSKVTRVEQKSLYWGAVVVSNIFVYGLILFAMRMISIFVVIEYAINTNVFILILLLIHELSIIVIFIITSLVASKSHAVNNTEIPNGMVKVVVRISFFITFFLCCARFCSVRSQRRAEKALILFCFMSFIYHSVMDIISFVFVMFTENSTAAMVTYSLHASLIVFLMFLVSFTLSSLLRHQQAANSFSLNKQLLNSFGTVAILFLLLCGVILLVIMYLSIIFSLNLQGLTGIVVRLIPTIALSAGSWYIKKEMFRSSGPTNSIEPRTVNQGQRIEEVGEEEARELLTSDHDEIMIEL